MVSRRAICSGSTDGYVPIVRKGGQMQQVHEKTPRRLRVLALLAYCTVISAVLLSVCTKSSFLYPVNDWEDANIFFTMGRGMMRGLVPYAELYDQKGPLVYLLYGLASLVSDSSFLGVYLLETLAFSAFLYFCYRILGLYTEENRLLALPVLGTVILSAMSITHGGSVEELCLPVYACTLYHSLDYFKNRYPAPMPWKRLLLNGFFAGCVLMMKYNMLGFYFAFMAVIAIALVVKKQLWLAARSCLVFLGGMALACLPWLCYFAFHHALEDFFLYYFYYNIFLYSEIPDPSLVKTLLVVGKDTLATFYRNAQYSLFTVLGVGYFSFCKRAQTKTVEKVNLWCLCVLLTIGIYCGGQGFRYYGVILAVFAVLGFVPLLRLLNGKLAGRRPLGKFAPALPCLLLCAGLGFSLLVSDNSYMLPYKRSDTPQYRFAAVIKESAAKEPVTLLNYGFLDSGFYLAAGALPNCRYFTALNIALSEVGVEQARYVREGLAEFVVTRNAELSAENYVLLDSASYYYEDYDWLYRLYRRVDTEGALHGTTGA